VVRRRGPGIRWALWALAGSVATVGSAGATGVPVPANAPALGAAPPASAASAPPLDGRGLAHWQQWLAEDPSRPAAVEALWQHLASKGLDRVVPPHQLLRSASAWQSCEAPPFGVPPQSTWEHLTQVLRLIETLRAQGVLDRFEVHSGHRDEALNRCAGGAPGSAHWRGFALDITPLDPVAAPPGDAGADPAAADVATRLCTFWRQHGEAWQMGLGRYPSGRLHLDTLRWRRWGLAC
jgi:hypothetical protein